MTAQIRPNRMDVSDRFPMLGFSIRTQETDVAAEVVLATDLELFKPEAKARRTAANFYSSSEHGALTIPRGDGVFVVQPDVLARFIGADGLFFALATGKRGNGELTVDALPRDGSPYVSLRGFTGRTLRRNFGHQRSTSPVLTWAGDAPRPGSEPARAMPERANGNDGTRANGDAAAKPNEIGNGGMKANGNGAAAEYDDGFGDMLPEAPAMPAARPRARAMIIGPEDVQKAQAYAPHWADLFNWRAPQSVVDAVAARGEGFRVQSIADAAGALNLDHYEVHCPALPSGWSAAAIVEHLRKNINDFLDTDNTEFIPYSASDATLIQAGNPLGAIWKLDIVGPDNAAVVISASEPRYFRVTTIETPDTGSHPVSGNREWGYTETDGKTVFYTRAADRSTDGIGETFVWLGADHLWRSLQTKLAAFINGNGGAATIREPFSERFHPEVVRILYGTAHGMAAGAIVKPPLPREDRRARARHIGGGFAEQVSTAFELGLAPQSVDPLLDILEGAGGAVPATRARARGLSAGAWTLNWDEVELIPQPTNFSCWAAAGAMLVGWRDYVSLAPESVASICSRSPERGLNTSQHAAFAREMGLVPDPPMSYSAEGFRQLLLSSGPLWVSKLVNNASLHAVIVTGMYFDGTNHFVRIADPWDRAVGTPGSPGGYASTHATGSRYIMKYEDFQTEYEMGITGGSAPNVQILHAGGTFGHTPNLGTVAPPPGCAMARGRAFADAGTNGNGHAGANGGEGEGEIRAPQPILAPPPPPRARAMDGGAGVAIAIGGTLVESIRDNSGDVSWNIDQFRGIKHPNDVAPSPVAAFKDAPAIKLDDWPVLSDSHIDDISAFFEINWQYNGRSLGNVRIKNIGTNDAIGWSLAVRGSIMDDNRVYPPNDCAALRITLQYLFTHVIGSDQIAIAEIQLFGDGTHSIDRRWVQTSLLGSGTPARGERPRVAH